MAAGRARSQPRRGTRRHAPASSARTARLGLTPPGAAGLACVLVSRDRTPFGRRYRTVWCWVGGERGYGAVGVYERMGGRRREVPPRYKHYGKLQRCRARPARYHPCRRCRRRRRRARALRHRCRRHRGPSPSPSPSPSPPPPSPTTTALSMETAARSTAASSLARYHPQEKRPGLEARSPPPSPPRLSTPPSPSPAPPSSSLPSPPLSPHAPPASR